MSVCMSVCLSVCACVRVSYIFCDPVLACITVIPVLLLHRLPIIMEDFVCLDPDATVNNNTLCDSRDSVTVSHAQLQNLTSQQRRTLQDGIVSCHCSVFHYYYYYYYYIVHNAQIRNI